MIIFNLTIDLARLGAHRSADKLLSDIANILHVGKSDLMLSSIPWSISEYRLGIETEEDIKKARFLMSKLKNAKLSPINKVQLQEIKEVKNDRN